MKDNLYSVIVGSGCYIPDKIISNDDFLSNVFFDSNGKQFEASNDEIIRKFEDITNIIERKHVSDNYATSDIAYFAAKDALESSSTDAETLDYIIVAHNFGDVRAENKKSDFVPSIASRVKYKLGIKNPKTVSYDIVFGCPGWLQAVIQVNYYLKSGDAKTALVIGAEILSRVSDPHDRDSMIYSDGAGAVILKAVSSPHPIGILAHISQTDTYDYAYLLKMSKSYNPDCNGKELYLKMNGRKLYQYALENVPLVVKNCIQKAGLLLKDISKVLIHQANEKMDWAILQRLFKLYDIPIIPPDIMPMTINKFGNSSVATLPTLLDLILKKKLGNHDLLPGNYIVFASVGAGMNINSLIYRIP